MLLSDEEIKIALYGRPPEKGLLNISETGIRSQTVRWLPLLDAFRTFCWGEIIEELQKTYKLKELINVPSYSI